MPNSSPQEVETRNLEPLVVVHREFALQTVEVLVGARNIACWLSQIGCVLCLCCPGYICIYTNP